MEIMQYKVFRSNEEFGQWQRDQENAIVIIQCSPTPLGINGDLASNDGKEATNADFDMSIGVFILYKDNLERYTGTSTPSQSTQESSTR